MENIMSLRLLRLPFLLILLSLANNTFSGELENAIAAGKQEYIRSCSLCHGEDAKGEGRWSSVLTVPVADLTLLKNNNNNHFPFAETYKTIDGRDKILSHEVMNMPSWAERFSSITRDAAEEKFAATIARGKIFELLLYLDSIQEES